jgi:tRNA 2-selenouridine synthase
VQFITIIFTVPVPTSGLSTTMTHKIRIHDWMTMADPPPVLDVRTPAEFGHGYVPGATNMPLFSDWERVQVGTTYKQVGREAAILLGFELTGTKWPGFIRQALEIAPQKRVAVHCWRGGMRSGAIAWALDLYGFEVYLVEGGYKAYRRWVQRQFEVIRDLRVIGGMTGSGKTRILHALQAKGEQMVDLEDLAQHQGSAYGTLNRLIQPSQEQFENNLAEVLYRMDDSRRIWVEDENMAIGKCLVPRLFWDRMQAAVLFDLQVPAEIRVAALVQEYGHLDKEFLISSTQRIRKRLGTERAKNAIAAIVEDNMAEFIRLVLVYYDKMYRRGVNGRIGTAIFVVTVKDGDAVGNSQELIKYDDGHNDHKTDAIFSRGGLRL